MPGNFISGLAANLKFSNGAEIIWRRLWDRQAREVTYVWRDRVRIVCDCARKDHVALQEIFCRESYGELLRSGWFPGGTIRYVNVGAHIGAFDLWLRERGWRAHASQAAELNPETFARCRRNFGANGLTGVQVSNCGIAAADGWVDFAGSNDSLGDSIFGVPGVGASQRIALYSLTSFLVRQEAVGDFDLLKLDCEGAEYGILRATPVAELRRFRYILAEFHLEPAGESVAAAYEALRAAGFTSVQGGPAPFRFVDAFVRQ